MSDNSPLKLLECPACGSDNPSYMKREEETNSRANDFYRSYDCECGFSGSEVMLNSNDWSEKKTEEAARVRWNKSVEEAHEIRDSLGKNVNLDLASFVHRLIRQVKKTDPTNLIATQAREYLEAKGYKFTDHLR